MAYIIAYIVLMGSLKFILPKKQLVIAMALSLFFLASFRSPLFGPDVMSYVDSFNRLKYQSLASTFQISKDASFYVFAQLLGKLGVSSQGWLAILSGIFIFSLYKLIKEYSIDPYLSFIVVLSLGYFFFSLTGLRQALAMSILLLSFKFILERKIMFFILNVLFASLFHSSALIFIIAYPLSNIKVSKKHIFIPLIVLISSFFLEKLLRNFISALAWNESLKNYSNQEQFLTYSGFVIQLMIIYFCYLNKKKILSVNNKENTVLFNMLLIGIIFQAFSSIIAEFFRVSYYFSIYCMVLIPRAIYSFKDKESRLIAYLLVFIALFSYVIWSKTFLGFRLNLGIL